MWQDLLHRPDLIQRLAQGPWGPYLEEFTTFLYRQNYAVVTIRRAILTADDLARWLSDQKLSLAHVNVDLVARYRGSLRASRPHCGREALLVLRFLEHKQVVAPRCPKAPATPVAQWLARFEEHLERVRGAASGTRQRYRLTVACFLEERFGHAEPDWSQLSADDLTSFGQREAARRRGFGRKAPGVALRAFLRFLVATGQVRDGLAAAIPSPRQYPQATLPDRATADQIAAVLACCQDGTPTGMRDYAVLLLLARLGLRAQEVVRLNLNDVDWRGGVLWVRAGKTRRERTLPLTRDVGAALAVYLQCGRPVSMSRAVFLDAQPPHEPWRGTSAVTQLAHRRLLQSGYPAQPWRGAHLFRHTIASQMVNAGVSFKDVADMLGHRSLATTALYAKLNLDTLSRVALPWPGATQ